MNPTSIHQAVHGYRDGHRLLSSSTPLSSDAARTMLVLSDMSGPSMLPGFDVYLTGYALAGTDYFVLAKTWYAPEMQRPGCVWTHSLLIPRARISDISVARLMRSFRRPQVDAVDSAAALPLVVEDETPTGGIGDGFDDRSLAATMIGAVLGQPRPVIVGADNAAQFEAVFLRLWEVLWPAERTRFSFCTGALMPRANSGALLDLQAVPRAIPPSQFRKSASAALVLDLRTPVKSEAWVDLVLDGTVGGNVSFHSWLEAAAGAEAGRAVVPGLAPIFDEWYAPGSSARSALMRVMNASDIGAGVLPRLMAMVFDRAYKESGATGGRELLQILCTNSHPDLASIASILEEQIKRLFGESRKDGVALVFSLLSSELNEVGECVLRTAVLLLVPNDVETLADAQTPLLSTILGANPALAQSPTLWQRVGSRAIDVLSQLGAANLDEEARNSVLTAILSSERDISADAIIRFGGRDAIIRALSALASGQLQISWQWKTALSAQPNTVLEWLESISSSSLGDLELGSRFVSPNFKQSRLAAVWKRGTANADSIAPRVAAFGLALAFWEGDVRSPIMARCFQPTYDAARDSRLDIDEWEWLREQAPTVSWWHDWDRCERLAAALARMLDNQKASLVTVFGIIRSRHAIRKVAGILDDDREARRYLKLLRKMAEASNDIGTSEQRDALLEDW